MYTPLPTPSQPWEYVSMDYMSGIPSTKHGNHYVFVVINRFYNIVILVTCKKSISAEAIAKLLYEKVLVHFGIP